MQPKADPKEQNYGWERTEPISHLLRKPAWIRNRFPATGEIQRLKQAFRVSHLQTVCEEATCPNLGECFRKGRATFIVMGKLCTRNCPFCNVSHGRPEPLDQEEPDNLAKVIKSMKLAYVVITSVNRDDLPDRGATHFANCIEAIRDLNPGIRIEILVPDFQGRQKLALDILRQAPPDVFNHNLETVPHLYRRARPGANYHESLQLLRLFKNINPSIPTKSGLMLGLGETMEDVLEVMRDLRSHECDMLTLGQYLRPSSVHLPVERYVHPDEFELLRSTGLKMGFAHVVAGPMVRSSFNAEQHAAKLGVSF